MDAISGSYGGCTKNTINYEGVVGWKGWEGASARLPTYCEATDVVKQEGAAEAAKKELEATPAEAKEQGTVLNNEILYNR